MKKRLDVILSAVCAGLVLIYGISCVFDYRHYRRLEREAQALQRGIARAEQNLDDREAVKLYKSLVPTTPEVNLRILQRQWSTCLDLLHQISLVRHNPSLEGDMSRLFSTLNGQLADMQERCTLILGESESLPETIAWRTYNLRGAVRLLKCFVILETERTWEKAAGTMKEAIADLKSSINAVDQIKAATYEKNIPRWNLELLCAEEQVKRLQLAKVEELERLDLQDNLEAIIPEKGGYAPGEPLETRVLK
jgi:hypothetical protein